MKNQSNNLIFSLSGIIIGVLSFAQVSFAGAPTVITLTANNISQTQATLNGTFNANGTSPMDVRFEYGTTSSLGKTTSYTTKTSANGTFSDTISGLSPNTTYYFRAMGVNSVSPDFGTIISFTTSGYNLPTIITTNASNVSDTTATLNGTFNANGSSTSTWFEYSTDSNLRGSSSTATASHSANDKGSISTTLSGLSPNTTYYFRAAAKSNGGTKYSSAVISFTTTNSNNNNGGNGGNNGGNGNNNNYNYPSCYYNGTCYWDGYNWVYYTNNRNNNNNNNYRNTSNNSCLFTGNCRPLCSYFGNCNNGNNTNSQYMNVSTSVASSISSTSATLSGFVYSNGSNTNAYFEYGTTPNLGRATQRLYSNNANTNYIYTVYGLSPNTTYYFRIVGQSNGNTQVGNIVSFKTSGTNTVVTTGTTSNTRNQNTGLNSTGLTIPSRNSNTSSSNQNSDTSVVSNGNNSSSNNNGAFLAAGAGFSGSFFPGTVLGWLVVILFILILIMIVRKVFPPRKSVNA